MTNYVPKLNRPVVAVRLKEDVMAPAGDWLAIEPISGDVLQLTDEQFRAVFGEVKPSQQQLEIPQPPPIQPPVEPEFTTATPPKKKIVVRTSPRRLHKLKPMNLLADDPLNRKSTSDRTAYEMLSGQAGRFFDLLRRFGAPMRTDEIFPYLHPGDKTTSVSAALGELRDVGCVKSQPSQNSRMFTWEVTPLGCELFDRTEHQCYTGYVLPIPKGRPIPS